ncbi:hypothetical protein ODJ79_21530 [Actinoplanes sp. KI2]|uniref:hypothetical protein n=1 Tax=Actinoplanes sp. KI2 TaxID=2983315 RepID=UPI0021D59F7A|nr:hypothetical protein [Actinoplanes sp. KI2]MCU7726319.1 hypothetical protein [Actinoplanes sp. KI2]
MKVRQLAVVGAAATVMMGLAGCDPKSSSADHPAAAGGGPAATTATTAAANPRDEFAAAAAKVGDQPVKLKMTTVGGGAITGAIDAQNHKAEMTTAMGSAGSMEIREDGTDLYVKASGALASAIGGPSGKWMHIDMSKVPSKSALNMANNDPKATAKVLADSSDVTKTGAHSFSGKVDMTKSPAFNSTAAAGLGSAFKAVPFTAETDDQGRIVKLVFDLGSVVPSAGKMTTEYSDFGTSVDVQKPPASQVIEMPAKFRKLMGA